MLLRRLEEWLMLNAPLPGLCSIVFTHAEKNGQIQISQVDAKITDNIQDFKTARNHEKTTKLIEVCRKTDQALSNPCVDYSTLMFMN